MSIRQPPQSLSDNEINYYRNRRIRGLAQDIFLTLLANPERYKYISKLVDSERITQEEANLKNVRKAYKLAETFINYKY
jgi:hypothetical protein